MCLPFEANNNPIGCTYREKARLVFWLIIGITITNAIIVTLRCKIYEMEK